MADAEVGDDVLGDDPTVMELQEFCADLLGKQSGLFVPSGSMGNQVSLGALTRPGDEVICEAGAHILHYEGGSVGAHLGLMTRSFPGVAGMLPSDVVADAIRPGNDHAPRTAVVAIENTHNGAGGTVFPLDEARSISKVCRERDVAVHLDGARIFNAQAATGSPVREWADCADTVTFCFSKGLGAPIGSMVCSDSDVITEAHRLRKRLGGGMRQVGVVAAAARVAIETGVERLVEDHEHARRLAEAVADLDERAVDPRAVQTNMVYIDLRPFDLDGPRVAESLLAEGVLALGAPGPMMRFVTHRDVSSDDLDAAIAALRRVLAP